MNLTILTILASTYWLSCLIGYSHKRIRERLDKLEASLKEGSTMKDQKQREVGEVAADLLVRWYSSAFIGTGYIPDANQKDLARSIAQALQTERDRAERAEADLAEAVDLLAAFVDVEGLNLEQAEVVNIGEDYYQRACAVVAKHSTTMPSQRPLTSSAKLCILPTQLTL